MKKYEISGKEKVFLTPEDNKHCKQCDDGNKFKGSFYKVDEFESEDQEFICRTCETKYKFPKEEAICKIDPMYKPTDSGFLTRDKAMELYREMNKIEEGKEMEYVDDRKQFIETGVCPGHKMVESKPFKTSEGIFTIKSCNVCKIGQLEYKDKIYQDTLMNLVNFVAHRGIQNDNKIKESVETVDFIGDIDETVKMGENLFKEESKELDFE